LPPFHMYLGMDVRNHRWNPLPGGGEIELMKDPAQAQCSNR
jgi:hypothetical protein